MSCDWTPSLQGEKQANTQLSCSKKGVEWLLVMCVDKKDTKNCFVTLNNNSKYKYISK